MRSRFLVATWVRPQQVAEEALQWWLDEPIDFVDVVDGLELGRYASMHAQVVAVYVGSQWHRLEGLDEGVEHGLITVVLAKHLLAESEVFRHRYRLVVSPQQRDLLREIYFQRKQEKAYFD